MSVRVLAVPLPLNRIAPVLVLAVPRVRADAPWMVAVPVKLAAELMVWELIVLDVAIVVMPLRAPALLTSKLVLSMTNGAEPPPRVIWPVLVPVLMLVVVLLEALREIAPPARVVAPDVTVRLPVKLAAELIV
jgi:hypothetical protein